jgi:hypothetical protein
MTIENSIEIARIILDFLKTIIPFSLLFSLFFIFRKKIEVFLENGGWKVSTPGFSFETLQKQQEKVGEREKEEIQSLNDELQTVKQTEQKLKELQKYTARDKDTYFIGFHFEKTYRLIFPSQMVILNILNNSEEQELPEVLARALFRRTIWASTKYNVAFEHFMGFLIESGLIFYDSPNTKFMLTPLGRAFWQYLKTNNIHLKIPATDVIVTTPLQSEEV